MIPMDLRISVLQYLIILLLHVSLDGGWVERLHLDTADTFALDSGDLDVSLISPRGSPGVSNDVVLLSVLGSVSNGGNGVIELSSTFFGVQDSTCVLLEDSFVGLDGD